MFRSFSLVLMRVNWFINNYLGNIFLPSSNTAS
nr:MAG TPA: hypothetical protein [Caudoviricetes sp.]